MRVAAVIVLALGSTLILGLGIFARRRLAASRARAAEEEAATEAVRRRALMDADWSSYQRATGQRVPQVLRDLYADAELITSSDLVVTAPERDGRPQAWEIAEFAPVADAGHDGDGNALPSGYFRFACNWYGDPYYIALGERADGDGPVYVRFQQGDETVLVAQSLSEFLSWPRHRAATAERPIP